MKKQVIKQPSNLEAPSEMGFVDMLNFVIGLIHTLVRFLPLGLYFFAYFSSTIYKDLRSAILLIGLIINDIIGYLVKKYGKIVYAAPCAIFGKENSNKELGFLPNPHTQIITFISSFYFSDMYYKQKLDALPFVFLLVLLFVTIWSRITIGCKKPKDIMFAIIFGAIYGTLFYYIVHSYYVEAEKGIVEKKSCELGYNNYRCDEIKNGTVIIKDPNLNRSDEDDEDEDE
jgi:hypothetical protein